MSAGVSRKANTQRLLATAVQHLQMGRLNEARDAYRAHLAGDPLNVLALHHLGIVEHQLGRGEDGVSLINRALSLQPGNAHAYSDLGIILMALRRDGEAIEACRKAVALDPFFAPAQSNLADMMLRVGAHSAAERAYARAAELQPGFSAAHAGRAEALAALGRLDEAADACDTALRQSPSLAHAHGVKGLIFYKRGQLEEAATAFELALRLDPGIALIHTRLGNIHHAKGLYEDALAAHERAVEVDPNCAEVHCNKALALQALGRLDDAYDAYSRALALKPGSGDVLTRLGILLHRMGRQEEAIAALRKAVQLAPNHSGVHLNLAGVLKEQNQLAEAADAYRALLDLGDHAVGLFEYCHLRRHLCDWDGLDNAEREAVAALIARRERAPPFAALAMACAPEDHLALSRLWANGFRPIGATQLGVARRAPAGSSERRIRLGYLSADFYDHATASLVAELFERHDSSRFELFAYCVSPDDGTAMRHRLIAAFDHFTILRETSHLDSANKIAADGIDILVDLKGFTQGSRTLIFAQRPAPIQVNYLGYPSTMGATYMDYIIADPFIAPMDHQRFYDERIVHLPDCYQPNDRLRRTADTVRTRSDCGLPEDGFVFCAFNSVYKITAEVFSVWMRLLYQVPGSALWLLDANSIAKANLRRQAVAHGIDPSRLVFAAKLHITEHQARYALADLFLDNLPVNAHTTASEALWAGVPVVTCAGEVFVGRVAGSLLNACGTPELVTHSLADYEALALRLATDRALLSGFRDRIIRNRLTAPLFDIERYARNLEAAFAQMVRLHEAGRPPQAFAVADLPAEMR